MRNLCDFMEDNLDENSMNVKFNNILSEINKLKEKINKESEKKKYIDASTNTEFDFKDISDLNQAIENKYKNIIKKMEEHIIKLSSMIKRENISIKDNIMKTINNNNNIIPVKEKKNKPEFYFKNTNNYNNKKKINNNNNINIIKKDIYYEKNLSKIYSSPKIRKKLNIFNKKNKSNSNLDPTNFGSTFSVNNLKFNSFSPKINNYSNKITNENSKEKSKLNNFKLKIISKDKSKSKSGSKSKNKDYLTIF